MAAMDMFDAAIQHPIPTYLLHSTQTGRWCTPGGGAHHGAWRVEKHTLRYSTALLFPLIRDIALDAATPTSRSVPRSMPRRATPCHDDDPIDS
jgi:hypothetical protein